MGINDPGTYWTTREAVMKAYDKLPPEVRHALQNANYDWAPQPLVSRLRHGLSPMALVLSIKRWDRQEHKRDVKRGKVAP
jgi:Family of unknown function (DUF6525)